MAGYFFISKKLFLNFGPLYLGSKTAGEAGFSSPDTHNSPQQRGAASNAEQPLFVQKKRLKNY